MFAPGQWVHIVGIGGFGMSAIARVLLGRGCAVSGSDLRANALTDALAAAGATVFLGHDAAHVGDAGVVLVSSAVPPDNPEVVAARRACLPVYKRADVLQDLTRGYRTVAVAGTHGKTTTTAMVTHILIESGLDPTYIIGGVLPTTGANAGVGRGDLFVIEADEYDHMFLGLRPLVAVITSIEHDHPDLFPTEDDLRYAFNRFAALVPPDGLLVACRDDPTASVLQQHRLNLGWPVLSYGLGQGADWFASDCRPNAEGGMDFTFRAGRDEAVLLPATLRLPGVHNVQNALAALAVADHLGVSVAEAIAALATFQGAGRRFEVRGQAGGVTVIDDYAHHPTAIRVTLEAARARYPGAGLWAVWQPHTYSRLRALFDGFAAAFTPERADHVLITDVYAARETPGEGLDVPDLIARIDHPDVRHTPGLGDAVKALAVGVRPGDVVLILSAGDAPQIGTALLKRLA